MPSISKIVYESVSSSMMRKTINKAYSALFEGLTPSQKTRREIRRNLPEPPGGWDSPATGEGGNRILTSEHSRPMSFAECLEYNIRNAFFHDGGRSNPKFEPGVARIAYGELGLWPEGLACWTGDRPAPDWAKARELSGIVRNISDSHADDYDFDLNGMSFAELSARFARGSSETGAVNEDADGTGCRYDVKWIPNFNEARKYAKFTARTQAWCLTQDRRQWNRYMKGDTVKMYICTRPGFEYVPPEPGENCPLDEYGLSMIGVSVNPDGSLDTCCTRWNHLHGGSDLAMDEEQLCKLLNVRRLSDVCPPYTEKELEERSHAAIDKAMSLISNKDAWDDNNYAHKIDDFDFPGMQMWELVFEGNALYIPVDKEGNPVFKYPLTRYRIFGKTSLLGYYSPYCMDSGEEDTDSEHIVLYSSIAKKARYFTDDGDIANTCSVDDIIDDCSNPCTYDYPSHALVHGIALAMHVDWEGTYLYDASTMDFAPHSRDNIIDIHAGNMFSKDNSVYLVTPEKLVNYGDLLASKIDPGYPHRSESGRVFRWYAEMFACHEYPTVGVLVRNGLTGGFFIVNPLDGNIVKRFDGVVYATQSVMRLPGHNSNSCLGLEYDDSQKGVVLMDGTLVEAT